MLAALVLATGSGAPAATDPILLERFSAPPGREWRWLREDPVAWRVGSAGLELRVQPGNMWGKANNARNVLVRPVPDPARTPLEITATLHNEPTGQWEQTNLVWFYDDSHMVKIGQELVSGKLSVVMGREEGDKPRTIGIVPLDAHTVHLRLLVAGTRIHGQYRTAHWPQWREVGDCDLPVKGTPHLSLQSYQGPPDTNRWARFEEVKVSSLAAPPRRLEDQRAWEHSWKSGQPAPAFFALAVEQPESRLTQRPAEPDQAGGKSDAAQAVFRQRDGTYGWTWDRRTVATARPDFVGLLCAGGFPRRAVALESLLVEMDVVSRIDVDRGQHALILQLLLTDSPIRGEGGRAELNLWFDWQGKDATGADVDDGFRRYEYVPISPATTDGVARHVYRLQGFRGAPPRVNLKAFLVDAAQRLRLDPATLHLWQLSFGTEAWNGSKGRTHVRRLDLLMNGRRHATVSANP
jgi:regulation of enolase protein 1 (concanavalin A-like superfamily)